jgi:pimeloyl-ACP methyl ester carboxylesterase
MAAQQLEINGRTVSTHICGQGDPVMVLHGWGTSGNAMGGIPAGIAEAGFQVHTPDLPGFGSTPPPPTAWSVADYAEWVCQYMQHFHLDSVRLIGHSFGGRISIYLATIYPHKVRQIVLTSSAGVRPTPSAKMRAYHTGRRMLFTVLSLPGLQGLQAPLRRWLFERMASPDAKAAAAEGGVMYDTLKRVVNEDLVPLAANINAPTLLIWGDQDADTPLADARVFENIIPDAGLVVFEGAGHYAYAERQSDFIRVVSHFFRDGQ